MLLMLACICGCSNDDTDPESAEFHITFRAEGEKLAFTGNRLDNNVVGTFNVAETGDTDQYASGITAVSDDGSTISILIGTFQQASAHTVYTNYTSNGPKVKADTYVSGLTTQSGSEVVGSVNEELISVIPGTVADCEIVFSEVTDSALKGSFSGTWYNFQDNNTAVRITEGEFHVQRYGN